MLRLAVAKLYYTGLIIVERSHYTKLKNPVRQMLIGTDVLFGSRLTCDSGAGIGVGAPSLLRASKNWRHSIRGSHED